MPIPTLWRSVRNRAPNKRRTTLLLTGLMAGGLVPMLVVQSSAHGNDVFCVGDSWPVGDGRTMEQANFPQVLPSDVRSSWPGGIPGGESVATDIVDSNKVVYEEFPDPRQKYMCAGTSAAPCVISSTVSLTYETWKSAHWKVGGEAGGAYSFFSVKASGEYGKEWGERESRTETVSNMAPYKLGDIIQPAHFMEWRNRTGQVKGGYFNTGAVCRTGEGEFGEQYEWRDEPTGITFSFDRNIGEGNVWMKEGDKTTWETDYTGQDGRPPNIP
jgi:hypothetical protein